MGTNRLLTYIMVFLSMVFWGLSFVWTKIVFNYYEPVTTIFIRLILSGILLFSGLLILKKLQIPRRSHYKLFLISALFNPFLYFLGENYGVKYSSPAISAVLIATIPVFSPLFAFFLLRERLSILNITGIFISFLGIIIMLLDKNLELNTDIRGIISLLLAVIFGIAYSISLKKLAVFYSPFNIIAWQNLIGIFYFLPLFLIFELNNFLSVAPDFTLITSLLQLAFFASTLAFVFFTYGTRELGVSKTNVFTNLIPVITALFSFYMLGEEFGSGKIAGMLVVLSGVILSQLKTRRQRIRI